MQREISKARVTKNRTVEVTIEETKNTDQGTVVDEVQIKCSLLAHEDLVSAFAGLVPHLIHICEQNDEANESAYKVTSFVVSGTDEEKGVTIIGQKRLTSGKVLNLCTPFVMFVEGLDYKKFDDLQADIDSCISEVEAYLNGKCAIKQMELEFDEDGEPTTAEPKKRGRKKKGYSVTAELSATEFEEAS